MSQTYFFDNENFKHYIITALELNADEKNNLKTLLLSFPHVSNTDHWTKLFLELNVQEIPEKICILAANAYDIFGNTVLGVAAEYGDVLAVQKLIDMGADINASDKINKLPLHWAINNKKSSCDKDSFPAVEVVKCLLKNGARTDITCYRKITPFEYARSRGFNAAAKLIQAHNIKNIFERGGCIFRLLPDEILANIAAKTFDDEETYSF